jgi:hypothetical protein
VLSESISFIALWFSVNSCLSVYNSHVFREKTLSLPKFLLFLVSASLNKINQFLYSQEWGLPHVVVARENHLKELQETEKVADR